MQKMIAQCFETANLLGGIGVIHGQGTRFVCVLLCTSSKPPYKATRGFRAPEGLPRK